MQDKQAAGDKAAKRGFYELLKQDVSWKAIKDVMTYEIPIFGEASDDDIAEVLVQQGYVSHEQLEELKTHSDVIGDSVGQALVDRDIITADQLRDAKELKEATGQPLYRALMHLKLAVPQDLVDVLTAPIQLPFGNRVDDEFTRWIISNGIATEERLDEAWRESRERGEEFRNHLLQVGILSEEEYAKAVAHEADVPFDDLSGVYDIPDKLTHMLPAFLLRRHRALPYKLEDNKLFIAFPESHNVRDFEKLGLMLNFETQPVIAPQSTHAELVATYLPKDSEAATSEILPDDGPVQPAVELLTAILRGLVRSTGTDVHIEPQRESIRVRYRIDGILHDVMTLTPDTAHRVVSRVKSLAQMDIAQRHLPQDGHVVLPVLDRPRNFRIATIPTVDGEKLAIRLVQSDLAFSSFGQLGMNAEQQELVDEILAMPNGLVLAGGPVGSGKTTTLYSFLNSMDCFAGNVVTIEDPVEYELAGVTQIQVNARRDLTFAVGLRAILRQDPDVIMVGEIRDDETAEIAVRAAMTGSLVLSSMHANSATTAIYSLIQLGVRPYMVGLATSGIIFQRLARRVCNFCREAYPATAADRLELEAGPDEELMICRGTGCAKCLHTGYHGRTGVFEILKLNDQYREAIAAEPSLTNLAEAAAEAKMISLREHAAQLVRKGVISIEEMTRIL